LAALRRGQPAPSESKMRHPAARCFDWGHGLGLELGYEYFPSSADPGLERIWVWVSALPLGRDRVISGQTQLFSAYSV